MSDTKQGARMERYGSHERNCVRTTAGKPCSCGYIKAVIFAHSQDALVAELVAALEAIKARGEAWLASDHDYSTSYADRPDGDRAANTMLAIARDALAKAGA